MEGYKGRALHTKSSYVPEEEIDWTRKDSVPKNKIAALEKKEQQLYQKFGQQNYHDFRAFIRNIFSDPFTKDCEVLSNFQANEVEKTLQRFAQVNNEVLEQTVLFEFDFSKVSNIKLQDPTKNGKESLVLSYNAADIKKEFNKRFKGRNFDTSKGWTRNLDSFMRQLLQQDILTIKTSKQENPIKESQFTERVVSSSIPNFPWGVLKEDVQNAIKNKNTAFLDELVRAQMRIKKFIFKDLSEGASSTLKKAMSNVWTQSFSSDWTDPLMFFKGTTKSNFISQVQGALGEFQTAVLFEYLSLKVNLNTNKTKEYVAKLIGNTLKHGEKLRTDVSIFEDFGFQVKNFATIEEKVEGKNGLGFPNFLPDRKISTTIHPYKFGQYLSNPTPFYNTIANYYFNKTYQENADGIYTEILAEMKESLAEIMNLQISNIDDTVCFYMIGGKYLVPASEILKRAEELEIMESVEITSSYAGLSDEEYASTSTKKGKTSPAFTEYWKHRKSGWQPTPTNRKRYYELIQSSISIRTSFRLFKSIEQFSIFPEKNKS